MPRGITYFNIPPHIFYSRMQVLFGRKNVKALKSPYRVKNQNSFEEYLKVEVHLRLEVGYYVISCFNIFISACQYLNGKSLMDIFLIIVFIRTTFFIAANQMDFFS